MNKTLFAAFFACALTLGAFTASAEDFNPQSKLTFNEGKFTSSVPSHLKVIAVSKDKTSLADNLTKAVNLAPEDTSFGYKLNDNKFVSLSDAMKDISVVDSGEGSAAAFKLGDFSAGDTFQFGYAAASDGSDFKSVLTVASDPGYYTGYNPDSFYTLDFAEDPFDGKIEILVMGEPLPASTVTLLVALGAAAALLLYHNKRSQLRVADQA